MSAIAAIKASTILGGTVRTTSAAVGVDKTYDPEGFILPGVARWVDRSGGIALLYPAFSMSVRPPTKASRMYKVTAKVVLPTAETVTGSTPTGFIPAPTVAYTCQAVMEFMLPERSTLAERNIFLSLVRSFFITTINASDDVPTDVSGSPLIGAITVNDQPF